MRLLKNNTLVDEEELIYYNETLDQLGSVYLRYYKHSGEPFYVFVSYYRDGDITRQVSQFYNSTPKNLKFIGKLWDQKKILFIKLVHSTAS